MALSRHAPAAFFLLSHGADVAPPPSVYKNNAVAGKFELKTPACFPCSGRTWVGSSIVIHDCPKACLSVLVLARHSGAWQSLRLHTGQNNTVDSIHPPCGARARENGLFCAGGQDDETRRRTAGIYVGGWLVSFVYLVVWFW